MKEPPRRIDRTAGLPVLVLKRTRESREDPIQELQCIEGWRALKKKFLAPGTRESLLIGIDPAITKRVVECANAAWEKREGDSLYGVTGYVPPDPDTYHLRYVQLCIDLLPDRSLVDFVCGARETLGAAFKLDVSFPPRSPGLQDYLNPYPPGIHVYDPPPHVGGQATRMFDGEGEHLVLIEECALRPAAMATWATTIPGAPGPAEPVRDPDHVNHLAAMLGILRGGSVTIGTTPWTVDGIAPRAAIAIACSRTSVGISAIPGSIQLAIGHLNSQLPLGVGVRGGTLLIELEAEPGRKPIEYQNDADATFEAIQQATLCGHTVVIPAGNGAVSIEPRSDGKTSGAIVVAGAAVADPFLANPPKLPLSNFGPRMDAWSWGEKIYTFAADWDGTDAIAKTPTGFAGTSGSAAIVAGAVVLLQQKMRATAGRLDAAAVRTRISGLGILSNSPRGGTGIANVFQPDLSKM